MHLDITPEVIVSQLEIGKTDASLEHATQAIKNTIAFDKFAKHIISLNDKLKHMNSYVALSNNGQCFKIKCDSEKANKDILNEFHQEVKHWSEKYQVTVKKIDNKELYYIVGKE